MNINPIRQINIFANKNNIHEMKSWRIGIGIFFALNISEYICDKSIRELFANYSQIENY